MIDVQEIGKQIGEQVTKEPLICWYPGSYKPPHKGHFAAAQQLAAKPYITQVNVLIGQGIRDGITAEQSKAIWDIYLKTQPNPKIKVAISPTKSPIREIYRWFADDLERKAYVAAAGKEATDLKYFEGLKEAFGDRVFEEIINDEFVDQDGERVSGTEFRATINRLRETYNLVKADPNDKKALNDYNTTYNYFKSLFPDVVINKGKFDDIQQVLGINYPPPTSLQEGDQPNPKNQPKWVWLEYKNKSKLNPLVFDEDETIDGKVKDLLLKISNYFWESLEIPEPFEDVVLTGSSANYTYTPNSDVDLHIIVDFNKFKDPELIKKYFDKAKANWNKVHDLKLGKHNIELYVQDKNEKKTSNAGVYSLMNDKWIYKPTYEKFEIPDSEIENKTRLFKQQINKLAKQGKDNPEKSIELIDKIRERIKNFRQAGLDKAGEYSIENLAFKNLRNTGYLKKLSDLKNQLIDKSLSLTESIDKKSLFDNFMSYACNELQIETPPTFEIKHMVGEEQPSFGAYVPSDHHIFINPVGRNVVDVLRTLAHELVHAKQNELGILRADSGETGSDHENDANSIAGILMRDYGKQNPNIYTIGVLNEARQGWYNLLRKKLPNMPEYVLKDWIYRKVDNYKDYESFNNWLDEYIVGLDWEYKKNFPMTMDIFSDKSKKELEERIKGLVRSDVDRDEERHKNQKELLKLRGISKEPIILFKHKDGKYDLGEGWHRTVQTFSMYPEGFIQPNVYIGLNASWLNESETKKTITCDSCGWSWKKSEGGKDMYTCHKCGHDNTPTLNEESNPLKLKYVDIWHKGQKLALNGKTKEAIKIMNQAAHDAEKLSKGEANYYKGTIDWLQKHYNNVEKYINDKQVKTTGNDKILKKLLKNKDKSYKEAYLSEEEKPKKRVPITRVYLDMDGVIAGFDEQFKKYNKEGLDFKSYMKEYSSSKAWDIINKAGNKFWNGMAWNPGGKQLYDHVMSRAKDKGYEVWILSSPGLDPNGDAKKGKNEWLDKHTNIPQERRVFKQAKDKHTEAKPGYLLIDDMGKNVSEFIQAGGTGIKNNPENSTESIKKLYRLGL